MALLFIDGFDSYGADNVNVSTLLGTAGYVLSFPFAVTHSDTRTGIGFSIQSNTAPAGDGVIVMRAFNSATGVVCGFAMKNASQIFDSFFEIGYTDLLGSFVAHCKLVFNGENGVTAATENPASHSLAQSGFGASDSVGSLIAASFPNVLLSNVWQYVEVLFQPSVSLQVRIDGGLVLNVSNPITTTGLPATVNYVALSNVNRNATLYDDLYICDLTGSAFNTFLGDVVVHSIFPDADTSPNTMTQVGGGSGHFTSVNEQVPDEDTSYVHSDTSGQQELYSLSTFPSDIINVLAVSVNVRAKKAATGLGTYDICAKYSGTEVDSSGIIAGANYTENQMILPSPPGGGSWTKSIAQATTIGFKIP